MHYLVVSLNYPLSYSSFWSCFFISLWIYMSQQHVHLLMALLWYFCYLCTALNVPNDKSTSFFLFFLFYKLILRSVYIMTVLHIHCTALFPIVHFLPVLFLVLALENQPTNQSVLFFIYLLYFYFFQCIIFSEYLWFYALNDFPWSISREYCT